MTTSGAGLGGRREAREEALGFLYELELTGDDPAETLARREVPFEEYAVAVIEGVCADRVAIDELLDRHLVGWRVPRLAVVDRTLARMAAWELLRRPDVPTGAVLSELVALATQYAGEESPRFLNGVLRAVADEVRAGERSGEVPGER